MMLSAVRSGIAESAVRETTRGWAVVEVYPDGTLGPPQLMPAIRPVETANSPIKRHPAGLSPALETQLGSLHAANGHPHEALRSLRRGASAATPSAARNRCLGQLALVEAYQGELRRATRHSDRVLDADRYPVGAGVLHAQVAKAWIHLERAEYAETLRCLDLVADPSEPDQEPWLAASLLLVEARLLMATRQPDAATRLLVGSFQVEPPVAKPGWISDLLATARAETLLAAGEPQRALAAVTPLPARVAVEARVVAAAARRDIGDVRGARALLSTIVSELEGSPLALQIQAWLLEARLAEDRGDLDRARLLVDRALRTASAEEMRTPLTRQWRWLRGFVDRDPSLIRSHRDFLSTLRAQDAPLPRQSTASAGPQQAIGAVLTEREGQVLDLLAQMFSTDEIAGALYVSANTVKTHLKGIFGKLCVNRRVDAVRRGRELGLC